MPAKKTPTGTTATKTVKAKVEGKAKGEKTVRHKRRHETFALYIYKVLKQVHPDIGISKKAMSVMNSFINDTFDRVGVEASKLVRFNKKRTLSSREV